MIEQFEAGALPTEARWKEHVAQLRTLTKPSTEEKVTLALINAVKKRIPTTRFGLFLSGGVDSSLLALLIKKFTSDFVCYSVGIQGSHDLLAARKTAQALQLNWKHREFTIKEVEPYLRKTAALFDKPDVVSCGVGSVIFAATELAKQDGVTILFGGLGSEEIFAGYQRHGLAKDINEECWKGLSDMWQRDLVRDSKLGSALGISVRVPFLDDDLIVSAMGISGDRKINTEHKKIILREIAEKLGLPHEIAWRQKKAAQYGSGFDKALEKLAKEKGVSKSEYVKSLAH